MRIDRFHTKPWNGRLVRKALCTVYGISEPDWELLKDLAPLPHFTRKDFLDGVVCTSWDRKRIARFVKDGYIKQIYRHNGNKGDHSKYQVILKWRLRVMNSYKIEFGDGFLPENYLSRMPTSSRNRHLLKRVKHYNKFKKRL